MPRLLASEGVSGANGPPPADQIVGKTEILGPLLTFFVIKNDRRKTPSPAVEY